MAVFAAIEGMSKENLPVHDHIHAAAKKLIARLFYEGRE